MQVVWTLHELYLNI